MRTGKTLSVSIPPAQFEAVERLAKKENVSISELVREALRRYQQNEDYRQQRLAKLRQALEATRAEAERAGTDKLTMADIDAEIAAYRREKKRHITRQPSR